MQQKTSFFISILRGALILFLAIIFATIGFELYLRFKGFLSAQPANYPCIMGDAGLNHVFEKNCSGVATAKALKTFKDVTYKTNALGTRGPMPLANKRKLLVMGDSYTEGFGLEETETFPATLEKALVRDGVKNIQVLNGGTMGYSTVLYNAYFDRIFSQWKPDFVLLNFDFTDLTDDSYYMQIADYDAQSRPSAFPGRENFPSWLLPYVYANKSAVLRFLHQEWNLYQSIKLREKNTAHMNAYVQQEKSSESTLINPAWLADEQSKHCRNNLELAAKEILRLKQKITAYGGHFALHVYPPGYLFKSYAAQPQGISFVRSWDEKTRKDYSWSCQVGPQVIAVIGKFAQSQGIPFFNSIPFVSAHEKKEQMYFDRDAHWTAYGVEEVVSHLAPQIKKEWMDTKR